MKILVIGIEGAAPELLLEWEELATIRSLMSLGCYGVHDGVIPPVPAAAWGSFSTSRDPGSLGVYGRRIRLDRSYRKPEPALDTAHPGLAETFKRAGKRAVEIHLPPYMPPAAFRATAVEAEDPIAEISVDIRIPERADSSDAQLVIGEMMRRRFTKLRGIAESDDWDYLFFVESGIDHIQRRLWKDHDPGHPLHNPTSPFSKVVRDLYKQLDDELARVLEVLSEDVMVLLVSDYGARSCLGGFCMNQWLVREGLLVLNHVPESPTEFADLDIDWRRTRAWSYGGSTGLIFLNVRGREPEGVVEPAECEALRDEIAGKLSALMMPWGNALGDSALEPEAIYRETLGIAPDLLVNLGDLGVTVIESVGWGELFIAAGAAIADDCVPTSKGCFVLAAANLRLQGAIEGISLIDFAPTLLELAGLDAPSSMQGQSFANRFQPGPEGSFPEPLSDDELVRERLSGLGYIA